MPSKIINRDMFLSDGFTSAMEISVEQQTYFLLLNEEKQPVIVDPVGDYKIIENADLADDVLKVEKAGRVKFAKGTFSITKSNSVFLNKNVIIREIFKKQNNVYVFNVSDGEYGWINYSDKSAITKIASDKISKEITIPELIVEKVAEEVEKINILYRKLFSDLNQMYPEKNEPPEIYLINSAREITLNLPPNFEKHFPKTVLYLVNELEIIITGTPFSVVRNNDKLQIKMKEQI
ncbi:MAG: hypothetical protein H6627_12255 [Calditrichae bacterium]|nr:hypothetical protein [Calditrichia bacterium]